jgi:ribonuclease HI
VKIRSSFVANSSSSSFVIITCGDDEIFSAGYQEMETCTSDEVEIDEIIKKLNDAKARGHKKVLIQSGGGYDG